MLLSVVISPATEIQVGNTEAVCIYRERKRKICKRILFVPLVVINRVGIERQYYRISTYGIYFDAEFFIVYDVFPIARDCVCRLLKRNDAVILTEKLYWI